MQAKTQAGEVLVVQVPMVFNLGDIGMKPLARKRLFGLMGDVGMFYVETQEPVGEAERLEVQEQVLNRVGP